MGVLWCALCIVQSTGAVSLDLLPSSARGTKHLLLRTTLLQLTCTLLLWALILCLLTVLLQGNHEMWARADFVNGYVYVQVCNKMFNILYLTEHMPTSSLTSLNKPKMMLTRFDKLLKSLKWWERSWAYSEHSNSTSSGPKLKYPGESLPSIWGCILPTGKVQVPFNSPLIFRDV